MTDLPQPADKATQQTYVDWKANTPTQHQIEEYVKNVKGWGIFGYHPELNVNEQKYSAMNAFYSSGPNNSIFENGSVTDISDQRDIKAMKRIVQNISSNWQFGADGFQDPSTNMIVSITSADAMSKKVDPNQKVIQIGVFTNQSSPHSRAGADKSFSLIGLLVPGETADAFEKDLQINPDFANELLINALKGIDETTDQPGLKRYKAKSLVYIPNSKLNTIGGGDGVDPSNRQQLKTFIDECPKIPFKNGPYGMQEFKKS